MHMAIVTIMLEYKQYVNMIHVSPCNHCTGLFLKQGEVAQCSNYKGGI